MLKNINHIWNLSVHNWHLSCVYPNAWNPLDLELRVSYISDAFGIRMMKISAIRGVSCTFV